MAERVWDRFLTEQDKATLVGKADRRIGFGERPALLLIDLYRWVFGDKPEAVTEAMLENPPRIRPLTDWSRNSYRPPATRVVATQDEPETGHGSCENDVSPALTFLT